MLQPTVVLRSRATHEVHTLRQSIRHVNGMKSSKTREVRQSRVCRKRMKRLGQKIKRARARNYLFTKGQ